MFNRAKHSPRTVHTLTRRRGCHVFTVALCVVVATASLGFGTREAHAFDPVSAAAMVYQGYQGVNRILQMSGVSHTKLKWMFKGMHHTWWGCKYADGTTTWNNFRSYRTVEEVAEYYTGQNEGDCDSFVEQNGQRYGVCYGPAGAAEMVRTHGEIVNIWPCCAAD